MNIINALRLYFKRKEKQAVKFEVENYQNYESDEELKNISEELHNKIIQFNYDNSENRQSIDYKLKSRAKEMYLLHKYKGEAIKLWNISEQSKRALLVLIMGEFKTGKSTFINTILEEEILKSDVTPATAVVSMISYGEKRYIKAHLVDGSTMDFPFEDLKSITAEGDESKSELRARIEYVEIFIPKEILKKITIVDTPGLNVDNKLHIKATKKFMNEADYVYWVFSYGRAASRTEVAAIKELSNSIKPTAIINKIDEIDEEEETLEDVIYDISSRLKGSVESVIGVSSYFAKKAISEGDEELLEESNWNEFRNNLEEKVINNSEKLKSKSTRYKIENYINELNEYALNNKEELNKVRYKIDNAHEYKTKLKEDIEKLALYLQASNEIKVNIGKYKASITSIAENVNYFKILKAINIEEKVKLLLELSVPLKRIKGTEAIIESIENYENRSKNILEAIDNLLNKIEIMEEKLKAINLESKECELEINRYNNSGIFGGAPIIDWNGKKSRLNKWADDINKKGYKINSEYEKIRFHIKNNVELAGLLNNEIFTYIGKTIYPVFVKKYVELNNELDSFNKDIQHQK